MLCNVCFKIQEQMFYCAVYFFSSVMFFSHVVLILLSRFGCSLYVQCSLMLGLCCVTCELCCRFGLVFFAQVRHLILFSQSFSSHMDNRYHHPRNVILCLPTIFHHDSSIVLRLVCFCQECLSNGCFLAFPILIVLSQQIFFFRFSLCELCFFHSGASSCFLFFNFFLFHFFSFPIHKFLSHQPFPFSFSFFIFFFILQIPSLFHLCLFLWFFLLPLPFNNTTSPNKTTCYSLYIISFPKL